jgi:hypothetical protein
MLPCQPCAVGRDTTATLTQQVAATDCFVVDGFGVFDQSGQTAAAQWFDAGVASFSSAEKAALEVAECPVGCYSDSQNRHSDTAARCVTCPAGSVTEETGSTDVTQCTGEDGMERKVDTRLDAGVLLNCIACRHIHVQRCLS